MPLAVLAVRTLVCVFLLPAHSHSVIVQFFACLSCVVSKLAVRTLCPMPDALCPLPVLFVIDPASVGKGLSWRHGRVTRVHSKASSMSLHDDTTSYTLVQARAGRA